ncbi:hypothetical protein DB313_05595 (plasmid) [Borrelia turcica IST7]|uniref:Uncharacterized protein n=1 Tax=Borrelia turcica IST7 TaxID=1104446 RepID=A0A386PP18_9SPIR|nr:DUF777 family protein [Borrelia turcica]AYE36972.1 hypothetical protein DB313_05595 [Borrelia turcica IST7]
MQTQNYNEFRYYTNLENMAYIHHETLDKMCQHIFISRLGIVKEFDPKTQEGIVVIPEFGSLNIATKNISNMQLYLKEKDKVILLQSSVNLFDTKDTNYFDKTYFYILNRVDIKTIEKAIIDIDQFALKHHKLDIEAEETINIKSEDKLNIDSQDLALNSSTIKLKSEDKFNIDSQDLALNSSTIKLKSEDKFNIDSQDLALNSSAIKLKSSNPISISTNNESLYGILNSLLDTLQELKFVQEAGAMAELQLKMPLLKVRLQQLLS